MATAEVHREPRGSRHLLRALRYRILMPVLARDVPNGNVATLGFLTAASGVGALAAAVYLAGSRSVIGFGRLIAWSAAVFGLGLVLLALSETLWVAMLLVLLTGTAFMLQMAASNTVIQTLVPDDRRACVQIGIIPEESHGVRSATRVPLDNEDEQRP